MRGVSCAGLAMWFDAQAALAKIGGDAAPPSAPAPPDKREAQLAGIAEIAGEGADVLKPSSSAARQPMALPYGESVGGRPLTYTGRVVSLNARRAQSDWERHGPGNRIWDGAAKQWTQIEGKTK